MSDARRAETLTPFVTTEGATRRLAVLVEGARCAGCIASIEVLAAAEPGVAARFNLTLNRLTLEWCGEAAVADACAARLRQGGYQVAPFALEAVDAVERRVSRELLKALAVAGFASSNVMMLAVAVWAGQAHDMPPATQHLLQWLSMMIAVPAVLYAGRPFYRSGWRALRAGRSNMDVPISLGVLLTLGMSVAEALRRGADVYFDSALALLFVLLIGRWFEHAARARSRVAVQRLAAMRPDTAEVVAADGAVRTVRAEELTPGMTIRIRPGETCPADAVVLEGRSDLDVSLVTGESLPAAVGPGGLVLSGSINAQGLLTARVARAVEDSHLASVVRLVEAAEARGGRRRALADRVASVWTPVVHGAALATFIGWWLFSGDPGRALVTAVSVLIIACPCAVGLAVPTVQVRAAGALLRRGVLMRSGAALEALAEIDHVVLDKTGTLTRGRMRATEVPDDPAVRAAAAALGQASLHPLSRATAAVSAPAGNVSDIIEHPGQGVVGRDAGGDIRLGSWAFVTHGERRDDEERVIGHEVWFGRAGQALGRYVFCDDLRPDAIQTVSDLRAWGLEVEILSGDAPAAVAKIARALGVDAALGGQTPAMKQERLHALRAQGRRVLMVGDGLNDAPSLAAAEVSASFADAAGVSRILADFVLPSERLSRLTEAIAVARRVRSVVRQNLGLAFAYNAALAPLAMAGLVTPFWAAIAMAISSLTVTLNALRVGVQGRGDAE